jgi:hypothetical protein
MDIYISTATSDIPEDTIVIQMDFISNVILDSPLADASMHYDKPQLTFFCCCVHYVGDDGIKTHKYVDFFSNYLGHDTHFVFYVLEYVHDAFSERKRILSVSDGADARFRNRYAHRSMPIFAFEKKIQLAWSILCPYHGKRYPT